MTRSDQERLERLGQHRLTDELRRELARVVAVRRQLVTQTPLYGEQWVAEALRAGLANRLERRGGQP